MACDLNNNPALLENMSFEIFSKFVISKSNEKETTASQKKNTQETQSKQRHRRTR